MAEKLFSQEEVNRIVSARLNRERDHLTKEYENSLKRCMASVHLTLYQELCLLKKEIAVEANDPLWSDSKENQTTQPSSFQETALRQAQKGGENA